MNTKKALLAALSILILTLGLLPTARVSAQTPEPPSDDDVNAIARELFCPICENTPLDVCPTEACRDWRDLIRQMLVEGRNEEEIKQFFVENYGARVLGAPPAEGINWLAYILPPVAFVIGAVLLFQAFRTWKKMAMEQNVGIHPRIPNPGQENSSTTSDDEYAARLEAELKRRR
jgi:cytochrome c-type biogenesis protein CcmH